MADYKRLVSYIYNYEAGIRKRNVGFSRVESKNGQCKVTIHITAGISPVEPLKVYLFHRKGRMIEGILFGEMTVKNGTGDFRGETSTMSLMNTEYSLDDICGVLVLLNKNKFFGSQWDDEEIRIEDFSEYSPQRERVDQFIRDIEVKPQEEADMQVEEDLAKQLKEVPEKGELQAAQLEEPVKVEEAIETVVNSVQSMPEEEKQEEVKEVIPEAVEEADLVEVQDLALEEPESVMDEVQANSVEESEEKAVEVEQQLVKTGLSEADEEETVKEEFVKEDVEPEQVEASSVKGSCCNSKDYPECVRRILKSFPSVKPFPESKPENWVRIEPKDIGMLPVETWVLANNSFLLHGYYNYRHLVFGILQMEEGEQYVIGVPGVLQTTEQTMAGMFGFHRFVSANEGKGNYGSFGYWIQQIVL